MSGPSESAGFESAEFWPDSRYRVFCVILSAVLAILIGLFLFFMAREFTWTGAVVFGVVWAILDPKAPPNLKGRLTHLIFGNGLEGVIRHAYVWEELTYVLTIRNSEGDTRVYRECKMKNKEQADLITKNAHQFGFTDGTIVEENGEYIKCTDENDIDLETTVITQSDHQMNFTVHYNCPIEPGDEYTYQMQLNKAEGAYPLNLDEKDYYGVRSYTFIEKLDIKINYEFDVDITGGGLTDVESERNLATPDIGDTTNLVELTIENVEPGYYQLWWEKDI